VTLSRLIFFHYRKKSLLGDPEKPLLERKKLLSEGKALAELAFNNRSLRDALLATTESVAVGIHVENWSTYRLWQPEYEMEKGRTYSEEAAKLAGTLPGTVSSRFINVWNSRSCQVEHWWIFKPSVVGNVVCTVQPTILEAMGSRWIVIKLRSSKL